MKIHQGGYQSLKISQSSNYVSRIGTSQCISPKRAMYDAVSLWPMKPPLFGVGQTLDFMFSSHNLCRLMLKESIRREPPFLNVEKTLDLVSLQSVNHPFSVCPLEFEDATSIILAQHFRHSKWMLSLAFYYKRFAQSFVLRSFGKLLQYIDSFI